MQRLCSVISATIIQSRPLFFKFLYNIKPKDKSEKYTGIELIRLWMDGTDLLAMFSVVLSLMVITVKRNVTFTSMNERNVDAD